MPHAHPLVTCAQMAKVSAYPMPPEETVAIQEDQRVTRVFPGRTRSRERPEPVTELSISGNDVAPASRIPALFTGLGSRLDGVLERRLFEPFARIRTVAAVLTDDPSSRHAEQSDALGEAAGQAERMCREVLEFMRIAAGDIRIERRRVDLKVLCERVVDAIHVGHADRSMMFTSDSRVEGEWDPDRLAMLLSNLVLNAIQHGRPRPAIRIELHAQGDHAVLQVWNAGSIVHPELPRRLFEPFVCGGGKQSGASEGLGLGLFLAREIAWAHGGRIEVQSTEKDGTTFRVVLPRS